MTDSNDGASARPYSRRRFLGQVGAVGAAGVAAPLIGGAAAGAATPGKATGPTLLGRAARTSPVKTIIVSIQENHSFDHYFGSYPALAKLPGGTTSAGYGIPKGWTNSGDAPFHFPNRTENSEDPNHDWTSTHAAYAGGKMTGFVSNGNGKNAMGYYTTADIPYYYSLLPEYTLCAEYFCGILTETMPNRMVAYACTSGGYTDNSAPPNGSLTWPCITHLLQAAGKTYANYNFHNTPANYSYLCLWSGNNNNPNMNKTSAQFTADCKAGTLPNVVWIEKQPPYDEHPNADIQTGEKMMQGIFAEVMAGPQWKNGEVVILHTYDEGGGFFDHRAPKELDAFGSGIRVPMIVISPIAKKGYIDTTYSDHASINKFIEHVYGLPTLASVNSTFNSSTPNVGQGGGKPFPPRDGNAAISDLTQCFSVTV